MRGSSGRRRPGDELRESEEGRHALTQLVDRQRRDWLTFGMRVVKEHDCAIAAVRRSHSMTSEPTWRPWTNAASEFSTSYGAPPRCATTRGRAERRWPCWRQAGGVFIGQVTRAAMQSDQRGEDPAPRV